MGIIRDQIVLFLQCLDRLDPTVCSYGCNFILYLIII